MSALGTGIASQAGRIIGVYVVRFQNCHTEAAADCSNVVYVDRRSYKLS